MVLQRKTADGKFKDWRSTESADDVPVKSSPIAPPLPPPIMSMPLPMMPVYVPATSSTQSKKRSLGDVVEPIAKKRSKTMAPSSPYPTPSSSQESSSSKPTARSAASKEKRGAVFKKQCPRNILERAERVRTQRFFMIDRNREEGQLEEQFSVLGSTGNVYTVNIGRKPSCDCPDARKGNHCKHILFIYLKVLQVDSDSGHWYQKALLTSELQEIFDNAPNAPNSVQNPRLRAAMDQALGKTSQPSEPSSSQGNRRMPGPDDDCPICYDSMGCEDEKTLVFCEPCGNALHQGCLAKWKETAQSKGQAVTCVYCRANWPMPSSASSSNPATGSRSLEGYLNLGAVAGLSPKRDSSSYYSGARRGYRNGLYRY